jgi:REP element-mobilizing transposase RayT
LIRNCFLARPLVLSAARVKDRKLFLETLGEACQKTGWRIHAYVLMGNHYHLLVETPEPNLVAGMKWLQGTYTHSVY